MKKSTFIFFILVCTVPFLRVEAQSLVSSAETNAKLNAVAQAVLGSGAFQLKDTSSGKLYDSWKQGPPEAKLVLVSPYNDWRYWNGVLNIAMLRLTDVLHRPEYKEFALKNVAFGFDSAPYYEQLYKGEGKWNYPFGQFFQLEELDDCGAIGASIIEVNRIEKQGRYRRYIDKAALHILKRQSRLEDGTFVRAFPTKWSLWADDLYMSISFLSRIGELSGDRRYFDDAARQVINFHKYLFNKEMGLMTHCWYSDVNSKSVAFWGRANGWALVAQVDLLDRLPKKHPQRKILLSLLRQHILGVARYQANNGLWHQLLDKSDSYLETSCSAMFIYSIARAVNKGYIDLRYVSIAKRGWEGVMSRINPDGNVEGVCTGTVVSNDLVYYYHRPAPLNDVHGLGTVLLAGAEVLQMTN